MMPQLLDDDGRLVGPEPAAGIVSNPSGRTPVGVNSFAAIDRIRLTWGSWIEPRAS